MFMNLKQDAVSCIDDIRTGVIGQIEIYPRMSVAPVISGSLT